MCRVQTFETRSLLGEERTSSALVRITPVTFDAKMGSNRCTIRSVELRYAIQRKFVMAGGVARRGTILVVNWVDHSGSRNGYYTNQNGYQ